MFQVIADLEEERRKHAEDTAEGDDVTYILEKDRERLHQQVRTRPSIRSGAASSFVFVFIVRPAGWQLEFERCQVRRLEKEQRRIAEQLEEERAQHKQLSCALAKECKWASARALEEGHRLTELSRKLDKVASQTRAALYWGWVFFCFGHFEHLKDGGVSQSKMFSED